MRTEFGFDAASRRNAGCRTPRVLVLGGRSVEASATSLTADVHSTRANTISWQVVLSNGEMIHARRKYSSQQGLLTNYLLFPGLHELWGSRILHCPCCYGYEIRKKKTRRRWRENPGLPFGLLAARNGLATSRFIPMGWIFLSKNRTVWKGWDYH